MGSLRDCTWILGLPDYRVVALERGDDGRLVIEVERRGVRRYVCSGCGRRTGRIRDAKVRTWDDVPWAEHLGVDEIQRGKGQRFWTVLSDLVRGEVIGLQHDRSEDSLRTLLAERLNARQRAAVQAVCMDMHRPYLNVVTEVLSLAEAVFDKFHVWQHASAALDEVRRQEFFRAGTVMRKHGRGKRWLLLRRWKTVRGSKRAELQALFAANRRLFKAYVLREQLDRLWTYTTRTGVLNFLNSWIDALRWQRLPEMDRLGEFLFNHVEGIAAYCDHPVRFGVVESINTTIKAVMRRARGMRDEAMLVLKLKWATARPIRFARDVMRFLHPEAVHSLR